MNSDVAFQIRLLEVSLGTMRAFESALADVESIVTSQIRLLFKSLGAVVALVGAQPAVDLGLESGGGDYGGSGDANVFEGVKGGGEMLLSIFLVSGKAYG